MEKEVSLLWPVGADREVIRLEESTVKDLSLPFLCEKMAKNKEEERWLMEQLSCITKDRQTLLYRQEIFRDLFENENLTKELQDTLQVLQTLQDFQTYKMSSLPKSNIWSMLNQLKELEVYIEVILGLRNVLKGHNVKSETLKKLQDSMEQICEDSGFELLQKDIKELSDDVSKINSLQLGVNLDENLKSSEVVLLSIGEKTYSGESSVLNNFMGFLKNNISMKMGDFSNMSPLRKKQPMEDDTIMSDLTRQVEGMLGLVVKKLGRVLRKYVDLKGYYVLKLMPELTFYIRLVELLKKCKNAGMPVCCPEIMDSEEASLEASLEARNMYNIRLLVHMQNQTEDVKEQMVLNHILFNEEHRLFLLTGPNRGGKTILTQAVGLTVWLMGLGVFVPCESLRATPVDNIYTHFPADENDTVEYGRLGEEAKRVADIMDKITGDSLFLLNETYSTTSFSDGLYMARDLVKVLKHLGVRTIYNTHMHELAQNVDKWNEEPGKARVASLVMGIEGGRRLYQVQIKEPDANSYARDIAEKYGVTYKQLMGLN